MNINESIFNLYIENSDKAKSKLMVLFDDDQIKVDEIVKEFDQKINIEKSGLIEKEISDLIKSKAQDIMDLVREGVTLNQLSSLKFLIFKTIKSVKQEITLADGTKQEIDVEAPTLDYQLSVRHINNPMVEKEKIKTVTTVKDGSRAKPDDFKDWATCLSTQFPKAVDKFKGQSAHTVLDRFLAKKYVDEAYKITALGIEYNATL